MQCSAYTTNGSRILKQIPTCVTISVLVLWYSPPVYKVGYVKSDNLLLQCLSRQELFALASMMWMLVSYDNE